MVYLFNIALKGKFFECDFTNRESLCIVTIRASFPLADIHSIKDIEHIIFELSDLSSQIPVFPDTDVR